MNVQYSCKKVIGTDADDNEVVCGQRHFLPPGGTNKKCTKHDDTRLTQDEDYNSPDFFYVDERGNTKSRRGHLDTPLGVDDPQFEPGQRVARVENVENRSVPQHVWTKADDKELIEAGFDPDHELYPHELVQKEGGELDPQFQGSHMRDQYGTTLDLEGEPESDALAGLTNEEIQERNRRVAEAVAQINADILANRPQEPEAPQGAVVVVPKDPEVVDHGHLEVPPGGRRIDPEEEKREAEAKAQALELKRDEYRELTGDEPDRRWRENRLDDEMAAWREANEGDENTGDDEE